MMKKNRWLAAGTVAMAVVVAGGPAAAFVISGGFADDNVAGSGARAPGQMVNAGVARVQQRADDFSSRNEITATEGPEGVFGTFLPEAIEIIFTDLNQALDLLISALFVRAGENPPALTDALGVLGNQGTTSKGRSVERGVR